jgi:hypothetical protein
MRTVLERLDKIDVKEGISVGTEADQVLFEMKYKSCVLREEISPNRVVIYSTYNDVGFPERCGFSRLKFKWVCTSPNDKAQYS